MEATHDSPSSGLLRIADVTRGIGIPPRSLERAVRLGMVRASRRSPRRTAISPAEAAYLTKHWAVLAALREALRTEPAVDMAVVFGSFARGEETAASDIDVVAWVPESWGLRETGRLEAKLTSAAGRQVDVVRGADVVGAPIFARALVRDGRPLVDRGNLWPHLLRRRQAIRRLASSDERRRELRMQRVVASVAG